MSDTEAIMWAVEKDPALRSDFCNLTLLDERPTDERLRASLARALNAIPRLRQRVVAAPLRLVPPAFADDPTLDAESHVRIVGAPPPSDVRAVLDLCGSLAEPPLDRARPLWEFTLIDGMEGGRAALLQKVHHTITDGEGALRLSLALVDFERRRRSRSPNRRSATQPRAAWERCGARSARRRTSSRIRPSCRHAPTTPSTWSSRSNGSRSSTARRAAT
jgi:diacylglycerol O-acyltransferase